MDKLRIFVDFAVTPEVLELLQAGTRGHELVFAKVPASSVLSKSERDPQFATVDIAFGQPEPDAVAEARQLKWIQISTSGITRYDNPQFRALMAERKIPATNSASVYNEACAVHALSFMVAQARRLPLALRCRTGNGSETWLEIRRSSGTLRGETALILGYGAIGKRLAELLHPFDMKVTAHRRNPRGNESVPMITEAQLPGALADARHIINILPDSAATRGFFNTRRFAMMRRGAIFYNIGRGTTVNQDALLDALHSGQVGAAWLDVTEPEPLPEKHPLRKEPNCFITPHVAGGHNGEDETLVRHFLKNFERFVKGETLLDRVM